MQLIFVTGNENKLREAREILKDYEITAEKIDLPEYQGDPEFIIKEKAKLACTTLKKTVFVEDTSLAFDALKGLPGPYIKDFATKLGIEGLTTLLEGFDNKKAQAITYIGYCEPECEPQVFKGITHGTIVQPRGNQRFMWDPIFCPQGYDKTYAEMSADEKNSLSQRKKAFTQFKEFLEK